MAVERDPRRVKLRIEAGKVSLTVNLLDTPTAKALLGGRTPLSSDERPKLASRCNVVGNLVGDPKSLAAIKAGEKITVTRA